MERQSIEQQGNNNFLVRLTQGVLIGLGWFSAALLHAADMRLVSASNDVSVGEIFSVGVVFDAANTANANVLVADAIMQYDTDLLELVSIHVDDAANSDLYYGYTLSTNSFPAAFTHIDTSASTGYAQIVAGVPASQGIASTQTDVLVARIDFKARDLPANEVQASTAISLVFSDGESVGDSKLIVADGSGSNVLDSVQNAMITIGPFNANIPLPWWSMILLCLALMCVGMGTGQHLLVQRQFVLNNNKLAH